MAYASIGHAIHPAQSRLRKSLMKLVFAMLADTAVMAAGNKMVISGADIDNVQSAAYPAAHPTLSLVGSFELEAQDYSKAHTLAVEGETPQHEPWFPRISATVNAGPHTTSYPEKSAFIITFPMLVLPTSGDYMFRLSVDGNLVKELPLHALTVTLPVAEPP